MNRDNDKGKILIARTMILMLAEIFVFLVILCRIYYLQVYQADKYATMADENRISTRLIIPPRGIITDRNGIQLANNQQNFQALLIAEQAVNVKQTIETFKKIMPLTEHEEEKIYKDLKRKKKFMPVKIKDNLKWDEVAKIQLNAPDLPGIFIDEGLTRYYPLAEKTAHVVGYVSSVSDKDVIDDPMLEMPGFKIGKTGMEKFFEKKLRGNGGSLKLEVNAYGRIMKQIERIDGKAGDNIKLTLDARLQETAFDAFGQESGAAVLLDVHTGEILAFVSAPSFDANKMSQGMSGQEWNELMNNEKKPLNNKAISGLYSPGSTFKMLVALAGLENAVIKAATHVFCNGKMEFGNHLFHCWKDEGHGHTNLIEALKHSCDIFFYEISQRIGIDEIARFARMFGLGQIHNVGLENEKKGIIPDKDWKMAVIGEKWQQGETLIAGIGQGYITTNPLQLAVMTARLVNGGYEIKPTFLPLSQNQKEKIKKINVSNYNLELIKKGMFAVVNEKEGTAYWSRFNVNGQKMAGKTGTTQVRRISLKERQTGVLKQEELPWKLRNHALFVGYAPAQNPKYALAVLVEHGGGGSTVAAPIAKKILMEAIQLDPTKQILEATDGL